MYSILLGNLTMCTSTELFLGSHCLSCPLGGSVDITLRNKHRYCFRALMSIQTSGGNNHNFGYKITSSIVNDGCSLQFLLKDSVPLVSASIEMPRVQHELLQLWPRMSSSSHYHEV